jgi:formyltetrahydrofolate deformylase
MKKHLANITLIGRDKTGVVARVTSFLFQQKGNIEALEEQVTRGQFSMTIQTSWKGEKFDDKIVFAGLQDLAKSLGMEINIRLTEPRRRQRMAIMVTKEAHCLSGILSALRSKTLSKARAVVILSNRKDLEPQAKKARLPFYHVPWEDRLTAENRVIQILEEHEVDFVVLARFMKILSPNFVWRYKNKIINIHPSLLPSFPGSQAYRQAHERGVKIVGVSAHFVTTNLDEGPIIAQNCFAVTPRMTLSEIVRRGQELETRTLIKAVKLYLEKRLDVYWGVVKEV